MSSSANITGGVLQILGIGATTPATSSSPEALVQMLDVSDGTVLRGTANGRSPQGATLIQTEAGELSVQTDIFIKRGFEVAIQVERRQNETLGRLISIDGKSVPKYMEQLAAQAAASADDSVQTSQLGTATKPGALPSASIVTPEEIIPARIEAVLLSKPAPIPVLPASAPPAAAAAPAATTPVPPAPATMPLPMSPTLESAFAQAANGSRIMLDVVGVSFPAATASPPAVTTLPPAAAAATPLPAAPVSPNAPLPTAPQVIASAPLASTAPPPAAPPPVSAEPASPAPVQAGFTAYQRVAMTATPSTPLTAPLANNAANPVLPPLVATQSPPGTPTVAPAPLTALPTASATPPALTAAPLQAPPTVTPSPLPTPSPSPLNATGETPKPMPYMPGAPTVPMASPATSAAAVAGPPVFSAMVIGTTGPQEIILQTPIGSLKMMNTSPLPQGTQLQVRVTQILPPPVAGTTETLPLSRPLEGFPQALEGMEEFAALTANQPRLQGAGQVPMPGKHLVSDALFLLAALKGGDLKRWIGETQHEELDVKGSDLLKRLGNDFATLRSGLVESRDPQGWNLLTLPFHATFVEPVRLFYKRHRKESQTLQKGDSEHFLVDMFLSRFGRFQLDGMVKKDKTLQFDLMIRTEQTLAAAMEQDIRQIYKDAAEISGFQGTIAFRHGPKACVALPVVTENPGAAPDHSIVV